MAARRGGRCEGHQQLAAKYLRGVDHIQRVRRCLAVALAFDGVAWDGSLSESLLSVRSTTRCSLTTTSWWVSKVCLQRQQWEGNSRIECLDFFE
eukprot:6862-Amphidinium_carterae.1